MTRTPSEERTTLCDYWYRKGREDERRRKERLTWIKSGVLIFVMALAALITFHYLIEFLQTI